VPFLRGKVSVKAKFARTGNPRIILLKPLFYKALEKVFSHKFYTFSPIIS